MFAIIQLGGKQFKVKEKDVIVTNKIDGEEGGSFKDAKVLLVSDGDETRIGVPFLDGVSVELKILAQGKGEKIRVYKMKAKKRYRKTQGHRQLLSQLEVVKITG